MDRRGRHLLLVLVFVLLLAPLTNRPPDATAALLRPRCDSPEQISLTVSDGRVRVAPRTLRVQPDGCIEFHVKSDGEDRSYSIERVEFVDPRDHSKVVFVVSPRVGCRRVGKDRCAVRANLRRGENPYRVVLRQDGHDEKRYRRLAQQPEPQATELISDLSMIDIPCSSPMCMVTFQFPIARHQ
jgi:hypothetical protein